MTLIYDLWSVTMTLISTCLSHRSVHSRSDWTLHTETLAPGFLDILVGNFQMKILNWTSIYFAWFVAWLIVLLELGRHFKSKTDTWNISSLLVTQSALLARKNKIFINLKVKFFCLLTSLELTSLSLNKKFNISEKLPTFLVRYY